VPIVCGGDDCNDADDGIYAGNVEVCDGKDNDCDGTIDDDPQCPGAMVCQAAQCICPPANQCGSECVDKATDRNHCGQCGKVCPVGEACENGSCVCPATSVICDGVCIDTQTNRNHCGGCKKACEWGQGCENGKCKNLPCTSPAMYLLVDESGSMSGNNWTAVKDGIGAFVVQVGSANLTAGIGFFPTSANACVPTSYKTPTVPLAALSSNSASITGALGRSPTASSYLRAPLEGSLDYVREWALSNPTSKAAVVLFVDGEPNASCSPADSWANAVSAAQTASGDTPAVKTYVVGIGTVLTQARVNELASAGGTNTGYIATNAAQVTSALEQIRGELLSCP